MMNDAMKDALRKKLEEHRAGKSAVAPDDAHDLMHEDAEQMGEDEDKETDLAPDLHAEESQEGHDALAGPPGAMSQDAELNSNKMAALKQIADSHHNGRGGTSLHERAASKAKEQLAKHYKK
jgi:hypothetical protein